jgi:mono/diheme cytochrome c family protein
MSSNLFHKMLRLRFERALLQAAPQSLILGRAALQRYDNWQKAFSTASIATTVAVLALASISAQAQKPPTADLPAGAMQSKATTACLECHEARIILQQRLTKPAWTKEVDKMTKWGAVVDPADRDALIDYLTTNFNPDKPPYTPQRTSDKISGKSSR